MTYAFQPSSQALGGPAGGWLVEREGVPRPKFIGFGEVAILT